MRFKQYMLVVPMLAFIARLGNSVAYAASLCVHPTGAGRCFTSIPAAVEAASDGDRIIVRAGQ